MGHHLLPFPIKENPNGHHTPRKSSAAYVEVTSTPAVSSIAQWRHRRNLVEKAAAIACQIRDHLHLAMPDYANLFDGLFERPVALKRGEEPGCIRRHRSPSRVAYYAKPVS